MTPEQHARAKEIFLQACILPAHDQTAFLQRACGDDAALLRQVEVLLAHHLPDAASVTLGAPGAAAQLSALHRAIESDVAATARAQPSVEAFPPGTLIAGRYRIVTELGRGGIGVVYRADDLELHQTIAIKFLPPEFAQDPFRSARLQQEVRMAREVSHPNVCRVHDIGRADDMHFITMEYIDGEDLGALLKRIGRLPGDKAVDIARQLCAGLAAAHLRGVLHRDLKPTNVMLDGRGRVRITDFGLAGLVGRIAGGEIRAGTPRYMAPEQIAGAEVSEKSDIYSLGLVLYEMFTGQPAFTAESVDEYRRLHEGSHPSLPSSILPYVDPEVERTILACLRKDPRERPESALAVAALLPGGDLLAAALAAGETPSPEMVAAAGTRLRANTPARIAIFGLFIALFVLAFGLSTRQHPLVQAGFDRSPEVLAEKAKALIRTGDRSDDPADAVSHFTNNLSSNLLVISADDRRVEPSRLAAPLGDNVAFWYRERFFGPLVPSSADNVLFSGARVTRTDPYMTCPGDATVVLDGRARLLLLDRFPPAPPTEPDERAEPDWPRLFAAAEIDPSSLTEAAPMVTPQYPTDLRRAWMGARGRSGGEAVRIEAASNRGMPVLFAVLNARGESDVAPSSDPAWRKQAVQSVRDFVLFAMVILALPLARHNLLVGKSDRKGAWRVAGFVCLLRILEWMLSAHHVPSAMIELRLLAMTALAALGEAFLVWLFYLALEPYIRRFWPQTIVAWSRLLVGRFRDPLVGEHLLIGGLIGVSWAVFIWIDAMAPGWLGIGSHGQLRLPDEFTHLRGGRSAIAHCLGIGRSSIYGALFLLLIVAALRITLRRAGPAAVVSALIISLMFVPLGSHPAVSWPLIGGGCVAVAVWALTRFGLVCVATALFVAKLLIAFPLTLRFGLWYADLSLLAALVVLGLVGFGFLQTLSPQKVAQRRPG